jgi:ribosomal protein S18 acetylase RimI-like enzyme
MRVRPGVGEDAAAVAAVCLATARLGDPVRAGDPAAGLLTAVYAEPYLALEPSSARLLVTGTDEVAGYVLAAVDSPAFYHRWRQEWTPRFDLPLPPVPGRPTPATVVPAEVAQLRALLVEPERMLPAAATVRTHPSHLHIDLLPRARGGGWARLLLADALAGLAAAGSPGVHLGVDPANERALRFYRRCGFVPSEADHTGSTLVLVRDCSPLGAYLDPPPAR